jgi:L-galactose dehydrogenase
VHEAVRLGVNYFDVSPYYGRTKAEAVLGRGLRDLPRDSFVLGTKVGRYDKDSFDFSAERVTRSVDESLARLGVETLDMVQCHDVEFGDLDLVVRETIPALVKLKEAGKVRAIGVTGYPLEVFPYLLACVAPRSVDMVLSYCNYTLQNDRLALVAAGLRRDYGVGVINASPLSMGLLTDGGCPAWHPASDGIKKAAAAANAVCARRGVTLPAVAMQFALAVDEGLVASTLVGIESTERLHGNLKNMEEKVDEDVLREVQAAFAGVRNETWDSGRFLGRSRASKAV